MVKFPNGLARGSAGTPIQTSSFPSVFRAALASCPDGTVCDFIGLVRFVGRPERTRKKGAGPILLKLHSTSQPETHARLRPRQHRGRSYTTLPLVQRFIAWVHTLSEETEMSTAAVGGYFSFPPLPTNIKHYLEERQDFIIEQICSEFQLSSDEEEQEMQAEDPALLSPPPGARPLAWSGRCWQGERLGGAGVLPETVPRRYNHGRWELQTRAAGLQPACLSHTLPEPARELESFTPASSYHGCYSITILGRRPQRNHWDQSQYSRGHMEGSRSTPSSQFDF
ncbi:UNVERIFIED_CONTAM: hypothetical protein FKN15_027288 [Acipenser sinensis]